MSKLHRLPYTAEELDKKLSADYGNAIKGVCFYDEGTNHHAYMDDVSPVPHFMKAKVRGLNLLPYPFAGVPVNGTITDKGVTI